MAKNVFRITPRASQVIRAIEDAAQKAHDEAIVAQNCPEGRMKAVFNYGDFKFSEEDGWTVADFDDVEIMFTQLGDREDFLIDYHYRGRVWLQKWRGNDRCIYYTTKHVELELLPESPVQSEGAVFVRLKTDLPQSLNDIPLPV